MELMTSIMSTVFDKFKQECPIHGQPHQMTINSINKETLFIFEGVMMMVRANLNNLALENYDNVYRLWLTLLRHYPN